MKNYLKYTPVFLLFIFVSTLLIHTNSSFDQDLGRHLKLGEIILSAKSVPHTNLFSYTYSNFPFVNHHWLSEVIFFLFYKNFGVLSISYLKMLCILTAVGLVFIANKKISSLKIATAASFFVVPLLMSRSDERPEMFGFLFFSSLLYLYFSQREKVKINRKTYLIPLIQLLWVNMHITFVFGLLLLGIFVLDQLLLNENIRTAKWIQIFGASLVLSLFNPHGLQGFLYPLTVFHNYGYSIQENQNLFFLHSLTSNIYITMFWTQSIFVALLGAASLVFDISKKQLKNGFVYYVLFVTFAVGSIVAIRNFPFFVFTGIIALSYFLSRVRLALLKSQPLYKKFSFLLPVILSVSIILAIGTITSNLFYNTFDEPKKFEINAVESYKGGVDFFIKHQLRGPILNNFDIGGYLDYRLYPQTQVFVDNRPEAYPNNFFDEYKESFADLSKLKRLLKKYHIQTIIVSHTDGTPWGIDFIKNTKMLSDYHYVYLDNATLIMTRDNLRSISLSETFTELLSKTENYKDLLSLGNVAALWGDQEVADAAQKKAYSANPSSCGIKLQTGVRDLSSQYDFVRSRGITLLKTTWFCPYASTIRDQINTLE